MILHRLIGRGHLILFACLLATNLPNATAGHIPGTSQLGGWVYIDRNNDGHLAFSNEPNPEYVIGDVSIRLFAKVGNVETLVSTILTDPLGRYVFENIAPGTYTLRETQPVQYVDGIDTLGVFQSLNGQPIPLGASAGVASNNTFSDIVLPANVAGEFYNFGERGLAAGYVSKRLLLASTPPPNTGTSPEPTTRLFAVTAIGITWLRRRLRLSTPRPC
jgi:hypothetical protein